MKSNSDKKVKNLIIKVIICAVFIGLILLIESSLGYSRIPFNRITVNETKENMKLKIKKVTDMNRKILEISKRTPELVNKADKLTNDGIASINRKEESIIDIPSIFVYLEQTGKNVGVTVKNIEIPGLGEAGKSLDTVQQKNTGQKLVITATGSYKSFSDYIREIQINTKEKITVNGFNFNSVDSTMNTGSMEIEISL